MPTGRDAKGKLLVALPDLLDPNFARSVVYVFDHDEAGAGGVILNRPSPIAVGDVLPAWDHVVAEPKVIHLGGPVSPETVLGLAVVTNDDLAAGTVDATLVHAGIAVLRLDEAPPTGLRSPTRLFSGYAGWSAGQLEAELSADGWAMVEVTSADIISADPADLWSVVLGRQPGPLGRLAMFPDDPRMN